MSDDATPDVGETERLLAGLRFAPRASLGPEIAGRVRRGEAAKGSRGSRPVSVAHWFAAAAALLLVLSAALMLRRVSVPRVHVDRCCSNLDGGAEADDGYVVRARGRRIESIMVYEDLDGDRRLSPPDRVRLTRGDRPVVAPDPVLTSVRICCVDLDGEGPADDGLLVLNGADERVVLAGVFERDERTATAELR